MKKSLYGWDLIWYNETLIFFRISISFFTKEVRTLVSKDIFQDAIVCLLSDKQNYDVSKIIYDSYGTKDIIVRYNGEREIYDKLVDLGVRIIDPSLAMINLLDHFVRSPNATSILLGLYKNQETVDVVIRNKDIHGMTLRDMRFPTDVIVLSVIRAGQVLISHGFTRLRLGDTVTLVGTKKSVENVRFKLES